MRRTVCGLGALVLFGCVAAPAPAPGAGSARVFVADEAGGTITVVEHPADVVTATVDLSVVTGGLTTGFMPHNVQVAPDGESVWIVGPTIPDPTAHVHDGAPEQAIVLDPETLEIRARIDLGTHLHAAHVVLDAASRFAYVTATEANAVLRIDASTYEVVERYDLGVRHGPHGIRVCAGRLYIANLEGRSMSILDPALGVVDEIPLGGTAVQTACVPGGRFVLVSEYDTREVVRYDVETGDLARIVMPPEAEGPVQLYATADGTRAFVCDQGMLLDRPASNRLYEIDVRAGVVVGSIEVGAGAHGVVLSEDGARAYVTNTLDHTISIVDTHARTVLATVEVGEGPSGIALAYVGGGMP